MTVESELLKATKIKIKKGEPRPKFLRRIWDATGEISEEVWQGLGSDAQSWVNEATEEDKKSGEIPDFPDVEDEEEATDANEGTADDDDEEEAEVATKTVKAKKANGAATPKGKKAPVKAAKESKAAKPAKEKKERTPVALKEDGLKFQIKSAIINKPAVTVDELVSKFAKGGEKVSKHTISGVRADFRHSLKVLKHHGVLAKSVEI